MFRRSSTYSAGLADVSREGLTTAARGPVMDERLGTPRCALGEAEASAVPDRSGHIEVWTALYGWPCGDFSPCEERRGTSTVRRR